MTDLRTAAQQALEALKKNAKHLPVDFDYHFEALAALRAALAQQAEPVEPAAVVRTVVGPGDDGVRIKWLRGFPKIGDRLYTATPQRKPLTEEEIDRIRADCVFTPHEYRDRAYGWALHFARAVERAHGIEEKQ